MILRLPKGIGFCGHGRQGDFVTSLLLRWKQESKRRFKAKWKVRKPLGEVAGPRPSRLPLGWGTVRAAKQSTRRGWSFPNSTTPRQLYPSASSQIRQAAVQSSLGKKEKDDTAEAQGAEKTDDPARLRWHHRLLLTFSDSDDIYSSIPYVPVGNSRSWQRRNRRIIHWRDSIKNVFGKLLEIGDRKGIVQA